VAVAGGPWRKAGARSQHSGADGADGSVTDGARPVARLEVAEMLANRAAGGRWVIDPAGSRAQFSVKQFWGAATVHGSLGPLSGKATSGLTAR
jgi:polyisoprenoid-binding protein YceI